VDQERELIDHLVALGVSQDVIDEARRDDRLVTAGFQHYAHPPATLTLVDLAGQAGLPLETAVRILRGLGLPPGDAGEQAYCPADLDLLRCCGEAVEALGEDLALSVLRVVGASFDRIADAAVARYYAVEQPSIDASDISLRDQADGIRVAAQVMSDSIGAIGPRLLAAHLWQTSRRYWSARASVTSYESAHLAVGFVDLVGYTPLSQQLSTEELGTLVSHFESVAYDAIAAAGGRIVKLIGDEVMFVALDAAAGVEAGLTLIDAFRDDGTAITPRGAIAVGELLARDGDYYGPTVNLASRIAATATPFELLITNPARDELVDAATTLHVEPAGDHLLKGFEHHVTVYRVKRPDATFHRTENTPREGSSEARTEPARAES
jgi:adenylate cyclase